MEFPALSDLLDLQALDSEMDRLLHQRATFPPIAEHRTFSAERVAAEEVRDAILVRHRQLSLDLDKSEGELEMLESKLKEAETRLYAGGMSGKETEHKRLEVQSLRGQQEAMETRVLQILDLKEALDAELDSAQQAVTDLSERTAALKIDIAEEWQKIDAVLARKEEMKTEVIRLIPADLLETYDKLRPIKEGVAVGRLDQGNCSGCHLALSTAEQKIAAETDPPRCVHCRRILVI